MIKVCEYDLVDEKDVLAQEIYDDDVEVDSNNYIQYIVDSTEFPNRSIEIRIPVSWIKPELIEELKATWAAARN